MRRERHKCKEGEKETDREWGSKERHMHTQVGRKGGRGREGERERKEAKRDTYAQRQ